MALMHLVGAHPFIQVVPWLLNHSCVTLGSSPTGLLVIPKPTRPFLLFPRPPSTSTCLPWPNLSTFQNSSPSSLPLHKATPRSPTEGTSLCLETGAQTTWGLWFVGSWCLQLDFQGIACVPTLTLQGRTGCSVNPRAGPRAEHRAAWGQGRERRGISRWALPPGPQGALLRAGRGGPGDHPPWRHPPSSEVLPQSV